MEIWISDKEIIERINRIVNDFDENQKTLYDNSNYPVIFKEGGKITHKNIIDFCQAFNINYKYVVLGITPTYDIEDKNKLYSALIDKQDYTL